MPREISPKPGLQAERTQLAWERTTISFLVITAVLLFRSDGPLAEGRTALAIMSILLALLTLVIARERGRRYVPSGPRGTPEATAAAAAVPVVGWSTAALGALIAVFMIFWG